MKHCKGCKQTKQLTEFVKRSKSHDGLQSRCKVCRNASNKKYRENNPEKVRKYRENNPEKCNAYNKKYCQRPEVKKKRNARLKKRYHTDPLYRITNNLRSRVHKAVKGKNKSADTMTLLGCSTTHLQDYLTMRFQPGMTWENYGTWHADHMMPCASFDLEDPEQQRRCFHYTNLQPMWGSENMSKSDKIIYNRTWNGTRWDSI